MMSRKLTAEQKKEIAARCFREDYVIVSAGVVGNIVYFAICNKYDETIVYPGIVHIDGHGNADAIDHGMFDDEYTKCPESVLKDITDDMYEGEWIAECRKNNAIKKAETAKNAKLKNYPIGTVIAFTMANGENMTFTKKDYTNNANFPIYICVQTEPKLYWVNDRNQKIDPKNISVNFEVLFVPERDRAV